MQARGRIGRVLLAILVVAILAARSQAVLFKFTSDPSFNTTAPSGSLTNSGWQYEGEWITSGGDFTGTPIAPTFFLAAQHVGGAPGSPFVFNGFEYHVVTNYDDPGSDLRIWQVGQTFPGYAPLYTKSNEGGALCVVFGRGTQRGSLVSVAARTNGWMWGTTDAVQRWGQNNVSLIYTDASLGDFLYCTFDQSGTSNECDLSVGDSSGGVFIEDGGTWKLAGVNYNVDGPWSFDGSGNDQTNAALLDARGLYYLSNSGWTLVPTNNPSPVPTGFYSSRVSSHINWINSVINFQTGPDLRITGSQVVGADVQINLATGSNRLYRVDWTSDLVTGVWTTVTNNVAGTGGIVIVTDPGATAHPQRFYRATVTQ
jgi:hypothetical protein